MPYISISDLVTAYSEQALIDLTDHDDPPTGAVVDAVALGAIERACAEVDSYLGQRYTVPLAGDVPVAVADAALTIAWYRLHPDAADDKALRLRYEDAVRWLRDVAAGRAALPGVSSNAAAPAVGLAQVAAGPARVFGRRGGR
ncbi:gp436 family protein [Novosphingobium sp. UBA1939]|uniref:gp436 family protein n=1 Tax=Novosphingobium sp. UBA1939 TaxID=1946982 RepID=UPI0025DBB202|nr:DUF1320 domain-containing protein [Novosphingobium sp. UBA1939]